MSDVGYKIRKAIATDVALLPEIEREAATLFMSRASELGLKAESLAEVNSLETFAKAQQSGRLWVAVDSWDHPVGFALVLEIDGEAHLEEMDVLPAHGCKGLGSALLEAVCIWVKENGYSGVTLSTFRDVPWNGPFYLHRKLRIAEESNLSAGLARIVQKERLRGLRTDLRVIMKRDI